MRYLPILSLAALPLIDAQNKNHFLTPRYQSAKGTGRYAGNSQWPLGSSQLIAFQTTWDEYRIELWQQRLEGGGAKLSSNLVYNQSRGDDLPQNFYWTVQTYELQLVDSPVFFFWLRDNNSPAQQTSAYFNITIEAAPTSSTTAPTTSSTENPRSATPNSVASGPTNTTGSPFPTSRSSEETTTTNGLSTGAAAGIGVGVSFGVILLAAIAGFAYVRRRRRQRREKEEQQPPPPPHHHQPQGFGSSAFMYDSPKTELTNSYGQQGVELPGSHGTLSQTYYGQGRVELAG